MRETATELLIKWPEKIKAQKLSNKPATVWCRENGISYNTFQYWVGRIKKETIHEKTRNSFVEIPETSFEIEISLSGAKLFLTKNFDRQALVNFINLLKVE